MFTVFLKVLFLRVFNCVFFKILGRFFQGSQKSRNLIFFEFRWTDDVSALPEIIPPPGIGLFFCRYFASSFSAQIFKKFARMVFLKKRGLKVF